MDKDTWFLTKQAKLIMLFI